MSEKTDQSKEIVAELTKLLKELKDEEVREVMEASVANLFTSILNPSDAVKYPSIAEFLLVNKHRWSFIGQLIFALSQNYSFEVTSKDGNKGYVSPTAIQWAEDGVMYLEGPKRLEGSLGLYKGDGKSYVAIYTRDARGGEILGQKDFEFVSVEAFKQNHKQIPLDQINCLDEPITKLKQLLDNRDNDESMYQELLHHYPWIFGMQYTQIQRHTQMDDKHIPDFTCIRTTDNYRDIIEIKPPFTELFNKSGTDFRKEFHDYWTQAEKYLQFATQNKDYLRNKGLYFDNPKCFLILGYNFSDAQKKMIDDKRAYSHSPVQLLTYNDLLAFMTNTVNVIKQLKNLQDIDKNSQ